MSMSNTQLAFSVITEPYDKAIFDLGQIFLDAHCSLDEFCVRHLADSVIAWGLVSAPWQKIAKFELMLAQYAQQRSSELKTWRPKAPIVHNGFPYVLEASFQKDEGKALSDLFLILHELGITTLSCDYSSSKLDSENTMIKAVLHIKIPQNEGIQRLREFFYHFCDTFNVDGCIDICRR